MQMKVTGQETSTVAKSASSRRHIISKLHKAAANATHLLSLVNDEKLGFGHDTILHAHAYQSFLCGALAFEKRRWQDSLQFYSEAYLIHHRYSKDETIITDAHSWASPNSYIDANLRYSAYQVGVSRSTPLEKIVEEYRIHDTESLGQDLRDHTDQNVTQPLLKSSRPGRADTLAFPESIQWRSRTVKLEDAATAEALAQAKLAEDELCALFASKTSSTPLEYAAAYDDVLIASQDAVDAVKTAIDELAAEGVAQGDSRMQALQITRTAVHYALISWRIGRNRVLCGNADGLETLFPHYVGKPSPNKDTPSHYERKNRLFKQIKEQVVLHDSILQSLESVEILPGVASDTAFLEEVRQNKAYFHTIRSLAIAQSHLMVENYSNSLALLSKAQRLIGTVKHHDSSRYSRTTNGPPQLDTSDAQFNQVRDLIDSLIRERRGVVEVKTHTGGGFYSKDSSAAPLIQNLDDFPVSSVNLRNIVSWPPKVQPVPVKPIFLDVAYNYIRYPQTKVPDVETGSKAKNAIAENNVPRKGWFGFGK